MRAIFTYLTSDAQALGILSWISALITLLGFGIAIWQIARVKRAADAARLAAIGMARRIRTQELAAQLGNAHIHLETARNQVASGAREIAMLCLELSATSLIDAREILREVSGTGADLTTVITRLRRAEERLGRMSDPIGDDPDEVALRVQLREISDILKGSIAKLRYRSDLSGG